MYWHWLNWWVFSVFCRFIYIYIFLRSIHCFTLDTSWQRRFRFPLVTMTTAVCLKSGRSVARPCGEIFPFQHWAHSRKQTEQLSAACLSCQVEKVQRRSQMKLQKGNIIGATHGLVLHHHHHHHHGDVDQIIIEPSASILEVVKGELQCTASQWHCQVDLGCLIISGFAECLECQWWANVTRVLQNNLLLSTVQQSYGRYGWRRGNVQKLHIL